MSLEAMLAQYEKNTRPANTNQSKEIDLKNYFTTFLPTDLNQKTKRIRILPSKDSSSPFVEVMIHSTQIDGQWRKFICPKHQKEEACPFCEAREQLLASGTDADKELAKRFSPKKAYIVKVIDREFEADGPKFWRFNHDYRKTGILDKIQALLPITGDFTNAETGRDLLIQIARDMKNNPVVQAIVHTDASPLHADATQAQSWVEDSKTWEEVYAVKGYDYLEIIVKGGVPVWDKEGKKYVDKSSIVETSDSSEGEDSIGSPLVVPATSPSPVAANANDEEDDLPF